MKNKITMSVDDAAKIIHKNPHSVRLGLQQGVFPFGVAIHGETGRWNYSVIAAKVYEYAGITEEEAEKILGGGITDDKLLSGTA